MAITKFKTVIAACMTLATLFTVSAAEYSDANFNYKYTKSTKHARIVTPKKHNAKSYNVPSKVTIDGVAYTVTIIGSYAFSDCDKTQSITLPSTIEKIEEGAFSNCMELTSIKIPSKVTSIPAFCFSFCLKLHTVELPANLTTINKGGFEFCYALYTINFPSKLTAVGDNAFYATKLPKMVTLPASLKSIGVSAFSQTEAEWFILPPEVDEIKKEAFSDNHSMTAINMPQKVGTFGDRVFFGCTKLEHVEMPQTIGSMGMGLFERNDALKSATVSASVVNLPQRTFFQCYELQDVSLPYTMRTIGPEAFGECYELRDITLPLNLTSIDYWAFDASGLESITIPYSVTSIDTQAFSQCKHLKEVTVTNPIPPTLKVGGFDDLTYKEAVLHVPESGLEAYRKHEEWSKFKCLQDIMTGVDAMETENDFPEIMTGKGILNINSENCTAATVEVYNAAGSLVHVVSSRESASLNLPGGCYIVRANKRARKFIVR